MFGELLVSLRKQMHINTILMNHKHLLTLALMLTTLSTAAQNDVTITPQDTLIKGSADVVTAQRMNKGLVTNALGALSGQAAGVNMSSGTDRMAMLNSVRVRGTTSLTGGNDPLVIIDGVYSDLSMLATVYPADIESFTILKNAAETAQYGSRGASGVIVVKTKTGHGGQFHISYDGNVGFESVYKRIDMLSAQEYADWCIRLGYPVNNKGYSTNFNKAITRTGFLHNHHIAFSGGTDKQNYRASLGLLQHNSTIRDKHDNNFVAKIDLTQKAFGDLLTIDFGVIGSTMHNTGVFDTHALLYSAATQNPTYPDGPLPDGSYGKNSTASQMDNPMAQLQKTNDERDNNFDAHLRLTFNLLEGLKLRLFGSYAYNNAENLQWCPYIIWAQGQAYRGNMRTEEWMGNATLSYDKTFGIHHLGATLMGEYSRKDRSGFFTLVKGFKNTSYGYNNLNAGYIHPFDGTGSSLESPRLASFMAGVNYTLLGRYKLEANMRTDGSSMVGDDNTWGVFPSVSAEWNMKEEEWLKDVSWLSMLKLRTGYGASGNLGGIDSYNTLMLLEPNGIVPYNGSSTVTMGLVKNINPNLKWETKTTFNIGADVGFFRNRLVMTAEYYYSRTHDMLYQYDVPVPPYAYPKLLANIGSMSNSGFEVGLGATPLQTKDMELNINLNLSWQKNKLRSLSGSYNGTQMTAADIVPMGGLTGAGFHGGNNNVVYQIVGQSLGVFYLPHCTGLEKQEDGRYMYKIADLDGNGVINLEDGGDRYIAGQATPKMTLGSNISFRYKDFDISVQMNGAFGHKIYNGTSLTYMCMTSFPDYNVMRGAPEANIQDQIASDYWLESGDYLNIDYITLGWNVPLRNRSIVSSLRLSASVNNLATITGYDGLTPMINSYIVNSTLGIDDCNIYSPFRTFSMGLSISF